MILNFLLPLQILNSKLNSNSDAEISCTALKSAILYDGSVTDFDSRLCGFDIGTCLEVISSSLLSNLSLQCRLLLFCTEKKTRNLLIECLVSILQTVYDFFFIYAKLSFPIDYETLYICSQLFFPLQLED